MQVTVVSSFIVSFVLWRLHDPCENSLMHTPSNMTMKVVWSAIHKKCRSKIYPRFQAVERLEVPDELVPWETQWPDYNPPDFTAPFIRGQPWADLDVTNKSFHPKWNSMDGHVNRQSYMGTYKIKESRPLNPIGRTGLQGRGILGKWGPNHAADPIVTRWKRSNSVDVDIHPQTQKSILQFVAIQRKDSGEWAIPGGMVDPGEIVTDTLKREFLEEALNSLERSDTSNIKELINLFFEKGEYVYKGYVDDPRNTDNAWMETVAMNFHDFNGETVGKLDLHAGDDAAKVQWMDITKDLPLYANHQEFVMTVAEKHNAHL